MTASKRKIDPILENFRVYKHKASDLDNGDIFVYDDKLWICTSTRSKFKRFLQRKTRAKELCVYNPDYITFTNQYNPEVTEIYFSNFRL